MSGEYSLLDNILNPMWIKVTELFPMWVAPNLITLSGLMCMLVTVSGLAQEDVSFTKRLSPEYYYAAALSIFIYQTFDACDGKQARRTGSSSPLGQLFDHGCDAVSLVAAVYVTLQTMRVGSGLFYFVYIWVSFGAFYIFNWEEHYMGVLQTNF